MTEILYSGHVLTAEQSLSADEGRDVWLKAPERARNYSAKLQTNVSFSKGGQWAANWKEFWGPLGFW